MILGAIEYAFLAVNDLKQANLLAKHKLNKLLAVVAVPHNSLKEEVVFDGLFFKRLDWCFASNDVVYVCGVTFVCHEIPPAKINEKWCEQPKFAKGFAKMVDESVPISEETLYPLMLESYDRSVPFEKSWMRDDVNDVFSVLYPKMIHILSQILMDRKEEKEWLEIEAFQLRLFPMIQEGKIVKSEELFPILYEVYTEVLLKDYNTQSSRHDFVRLWRGLNAVGKAVGKSASFLNYPKYIIE